ncbi:alkaline phosphatase D family protein [Streptomyces albus]|uniref:alkaline phosphatase D family protein n=1 Tax=Streptomyces albus TaxID=1888 RepID=UPI00099BDA32|nr:alkaline phosphatase D family protein [Streptomyces albus]
MTGLRLGPLLRYVDAHSATVWIETDGPCEAEVRCAGGPDDASTALGTDGAPGTAGTGGTPGASAGGAPGTAGADGALGSEGTTGTGGIPGAEAATGTGGTPRAGAAAPGGTASPAAPGGTARSWRVGGHHYALVTVTGLAPESTTPYRVLLDGRQVWPPSGGDEPLPVIRTLPRPGTDGTDGRPLRVSFGSCRWAAPPSTTTAGGLGPDALDTLSLRLAADPHAERPDVLLLLGDQVYADETSEATRRWIAERRSLEEPPGDQVADYEEYTRLYDESWSDPELRRLLATVPSCMIFDDHDVIDDWNTSEAWLTEMEATGWWRERVLSGLMSYWVYQHLGNLSPAELAADPLFTAVREAADGTALVREFAAAAYADPTHVRWSYRRDFGRTRLLMVDTRAARVLPEHRRAMLGKEESDWLREQALADPGSRDHLLIGTSLPWLLPPAIHDTEQWNAALCGGERGARWARWGEKVRQGADLEHWAAFPASFDALADLVARAGSGPEAPATVCVLSGDVHHAYIAEPRWPDPAGRQERSGRPAGAGGAPGAGEPGPAAEPAGTHGATEPSGAAGAAGTTGAAEPGGPVQKAAGTAGPTAAGGATGPGGIATANGAVRTGGAGPEGAVRPSARVLQLTCSPLHNSVPAVIKLGFRFGWSRAGRLLGRVLARHGRVRRSPVSWRKAGGPWFGNQLMTLTLRGREATLTLHRAEPDGTGGGRLATVLHRRLTGPGPGGPGDR